MHLWYGQVSSHSVCVVINSPTSEAIFSMFYAQHLSRRHTQQWAPGQEWHHSFCAVTVNVDEGLLGAKRWHCWWQTLSSFQRGGLIGRLNLSFKHNSRELNEAKTQSLWLRPWRAKEMDSIQCNTNRKGSGTLLKPTPNNKKISSLQENQPINQRKQGTCVVKQHNRAACLPMRTVKASPHVLNQH